MPRFRYPITTLPVVPGRAYTFVGLVDAVGDDVKSTLDLLWKDASALGADAVIGLQVSTAAYEQSGMFGSNIYKVTLIGTAVKYS